MRKICIITGSRAEYGLLFLVMQGIKRFTTHHSRLNASPLTSHHSPLTTHVPLDFTVSTYERLLKTITAHAIPVYGVREWVRQSPPHGILLRHDVDRKPKNALRIAALEAQHGIFSTYYFRIGRNSFDPAIIKEIHKLGHEIGYHYEDLSLAGGDHNKALDLFARHLAQLRNLVPVTTICAHGRPLSRHDNRDLWRYHQMAAYDIEADAFLTIDYTDVCYLTDTGRSWASHAPNIRDEVKTTKYASIKTTDDLMRYISHMPHSKLALVTHPERWGSSAIAIIKSYLRDMAVNAIKMLLVLIKLRQGNSATSVVDIGAL